jgi:2-methylisocitrate lyase-like PEP mutase family enzyme
MSAGQERAQQFRALHTAPEPLHLVNVWGPLSARVAELAGARALGTSSFAVALAHGHPDGEHVPWPVVRDEVARIVDAVRVPVSVDIEAGRGEHADDVARTVTDVVHAGGVGVNLEDARPDRRGVLFDTDAQCARLQAARRAADDAGVAVFLNARCDVWFGADVAPEEQLDEARRRLTRYVAAGADGVFVPGLVDGDALRAVVADVDVPVNVMLWPRLPSIAELRELGVRRISQGAASFLLAVGQLEQVTRAYLADQSPADASAPPQPAWHLVDALASTA